MAAIETGRTVRHGGWLAHVAAACRRALSIFLRPRPNLRVLSAHTLRDIGFADSARVRKQP